MRKDDNSSITIYDLPHFAIESAFCYLDYPVNFTLSCKAFHALGSYPSTKIKWVTSRKFDNFRNMFYGEVYGTILYPSLPYHPNLLPAVVKNVLSNKEVAILACKLSLPFEVQMITWFYSIRKSVYDGIDGNLSALEAYCSRFDEKEIFEFRNRDSLFLLQTMTAFGLNQAYANADFIAMHKYLNCKFACDLISQLFEEEANTNNEAVLDLSHLSPLHATKRKKYESVYIEKLVRNVPAMANYRDRCKRTALHIATKNANDNLIKILLRFDFVDVLAEDENHWTAIHWAVMTNDVKIFNLFKPYITAENINTLKLLHCSAQFGSVNIVIVLLNHDIRPDLDFANEDGSTPLHLAVENGYEYIIKLLIDAGASTTSTDWEGDTLLHYAANGEDMEINRILVSKDPSLLNTVNDFQLTPLGLAILNMNDELVALFVENGADPNIGSWDGSFPPYSIAKITNERHGDLKLYEIYGSLLEAGLKPNKKVSEESSFETILHVVCRKGLKMSAQVLLAYGADPFLPNWHKSTALNIAAEWGHIEIVRYMIQGIAPEIIEELKDVNSDVFSNVKDRRHPEFETYTPLRKSDVARWIDEPDDDGDTPLINSVRDRNKKTSPSLIPQYLIAHGANMNLQNKQGQTALHVAVSSETFHHIITLLKEKPNLELKDNNGKTPAELYAEKRPNRKEDDFILRGLKGENLDWKSEDMLMFNLMLMERMMREMEEEEFSEEDNESDYVYEESYYGDYYDNDEEEDEDDFGDEGDEEDEWEDIDDDDELEVD
ncbi:hypothetical protein HK098_002979 [Nowakowskiella sp. JEL0407]|nr:hypothetical protein HK098_002979 [Nowakowskiella sp. JEL0407]